MSSSWPIQSLWAWGKRYGQDCPRFANPEPEYWRPFAVEQKAESRKGLRCRGHVDHIAFLSMISYPAEPKGLLVRLRTLVVRTSLYTGLQVGGFMSLLALPSNRRLAPAGWTFSVWNWEVCWTLGDSTRALDAVKTLMIWSFTFQVVSSDTSRGGYSWFHDSVPHTLWFVPYFSDVFHVFFPTPPNPGWFFYPRSPEQPKVASPKRRLTISAGSIIDYGSLEFIGISEGQYRFKAEGPLSFLKAEAARTGEVAQLFFF